MPALHPRPRCAGTLDRLLLETDHQLAGTFGVSGRLGRPQDHQRGRIGRVVDGASWQRERSRHLRQAFPALLAIAIADDQLADRSDVTSRGDGHVQRQRLLLQLELRVEVVADQGVKESCARPRAALHMLLTGVQVGLGHLGSDLVEGRRRRSWRSA